MNADKKKPGESEEDFEDLWLKTPGKNRDEENMPEYKFQDDSRRTFLIIASIVIVFLFGGVLWYLYYQKNVAEPEDLTVYEADAEPVRTKPDEPGGMEVEHQDMEIFDRASGEMRDLDDSVKPGAEDPAAGETERSIEDLIAETEPERTAEAEEEPVKAYIPERDLYLIQLGAFSTKEGAERAWTILYGDYKTILGDLTPNIQEVTGSNGKTLYRLRAGFFSGKDEAEEMCRRIIAQGRECITTNK